MVQGTRRTHTKNLAKRRKRRLYAQLQAELQVHESPEELERMAMEEEEARQVCHDLWVRATANADAAFKKKQRILEERKRLMDDIKQQMEQETLEKEMHDQECCVAFTSALECAASAIDAVASMLLQVRPPQLDEREIRQAYRVFFTDVLQEFLKFGHLVQLHLLPELTPMTSWADAICGLFARRRCVRGGDCNFLHPLANPVERSPPTLRYRSPSASGIY
ncbi:hypothetical protein DYB38_010058 [Aphanomyces astaci]|uniref:C3H1-type domain-containing protein n=1 Tax=Aphanomyces astaci TaxID=112090 RepID=A0A397DCN4_APHAT|nr:hypothetical protein DYB38_010058 [Aphanomyces astaci]